MTTKVKATVAAVAVAASAGTPLIVQHQTNKSLRAENQALLAQTSQLAALQAENEQLSARVIQASNTSLSDEQRLELTRLRGVASRAIRAEAELAQLKSALSARRTSSTGPAPDPNSSTGALLAYLGEAVPPPPDIDPAYSQNGLLNAVQEAARVAGVSLKRVEIETSEFPFLAGVVCDSAVDFKKLTAQFKNMPNYEFGASTGGDEICAFDLTPYRNLPAQAEQRIRRRTSIRTQLLYDQLK